MHKHRVWLILKEYHQLLKYLKKEESYDNEVSLSGFYWFCEMDDRYCPLDPSRPKDPRVDMYNSYNNYIKYFENRPIDTNTIDGILAKKYLYKIKELGKNFDWEKLSEGLFDEMQKELFLFKKKYDPWGIKYIWYSL